MNKILTNSLFGFISIFLSQIAYAACTPNISNTSNSSSSTLSSTASSDCVENSGTITLSGFMEHGITSSALSTSITNSGTINLSGNDGLGIRSTGATSTISNSGTINTSGNYSYAIWTSGTGTSSTIINTASGIITTSGNNATAIYSSGANSTITNNGIISTTGIDTYGIYSSGANSNISNANTINTSGYNGKGIGSQGANSANVNNGTISTIGSYAHGTFSYGVGSVNTNNHNITTAGNYAYGIWSQGANSTNVNNGTISTSGVSAYGIFTTDTNSTNSNIGTISTSGSNARGIYSSGAYTANTNSGTISTSGSGAQGIYSSGANTTITNYGTISTSASNTAGIETSITANNPTIINYGTITTNGNSDAIHSFASGGTYINNGTLILAGGNAGKGGINLASAPNSTIINNGNISGTTDYVRGLWSNGANNIVKNNGTINISGNDGIGIMSSNGSNVAIVNNGSIVVSGDNGLGMEISNPNSTLDNNGAIRATGQNAYAIMINDANNTVNLNRGSVVVGDIHADGGATGARLNINLGAGASYAYSVTGPWTMADLDNRPMVTGSAYAAGIGAQETASEMLYQRTSAITSSLDRRLRSYAADEVDNQPYWLDVYYSDVSRNSGGNFSTQTAFSNYNYGITAGFKLPNETTPLELIVNVAQSNLNIDSGNQKIDSTSLMAGLLAPNLADLLGAKLSAKAMVGYANHDGDRKVMTNSLLYDGSRQIESDYNSFYGVLGAALTKIYPITGHLNADVLLGLDINTERVESYKETDYFAWDGRTLTQLQSRLQAGLDYRFNENKASIFARVGAENRNLIGGAIQDYEINHINVSFNTNNKNDTYLTAQIGVRAQLEKRISVYGVVSTLYSADSVNTVQGNIGLRADF